ncbi:hypothetical protein PIB30_077770 [Stylosanthes scabra]|uniref:Uncharacterized protein n=1 Tax=Stylosanthes scabra TaxID=79078 RepID=A0ABU6WNX8_9FABA|nr:hypothetical protein [Stylosanthes scabra]
MDILRPSRQWQQESETLSNHDAEDGAITVLGISGGTENGSADAMTAAQRGHPSCLTEMAAPVVSTSFVAFFQDIHPYLSLYLWALSLVHFSLHRRTPIFLSISSPLLSSSTNTAQIEAGNRDDILYISESETLSNHDAEDGAIAVLGISGGTENDSAEALTAAQHGHPSCLTAMATAVASTSFVPFFQDIHPYLSLCLWALSLLHFSLHRRTPIFLSISSPLLSSSTNTAQIEAGSRDDILYILNRYFICVYSIPFYCGED